MKRILLLTAFIAIMMGCKESSVIDSLLGKAWTEKEQQNVVEEYIKRIEALQKSLQ